MIPEIAPYTSDSNRLIIVTSPDWEKPEATMQWFEKENGSDVWHAESQPFPVVAGKSGLIWGQNLAPLPEGVTSFKKEGDMKTPAGLFGFCFAFGYAAHLPEGTEMPYLALDENFVGVDDPASRYYNCIVNEKVLGHKDWSSAEKMMREDGQYKWGLVVDYNFENGKPGAGSQIFVHIWQDENTGTAGCIGMPEDKLVAMLAWMASGTKPLIWIH